MSIVQVVHSGTNVNIYAVTTPTITKYPCFRSTGAGQKKTLPTPTTCHSCKQSRDPPATPVTARGTTSATEKLRFDQIRMRCKLGQGESHREVVQEEDE